MRYGKGPLSLPSQLSPDKTDRLAPPRAPSIVQAVEPPPAERARAARLARRVARRVLGRRLTTGIRTHLLEPAELSRNAVARIAVVERELDALRRASAGMASAHREVHAATINQELMKGEVRSVVESLEELGMAIAPAAGLAGARARLSELRERVNGLDRRLRAVVGNGAGATDHGAGDTGPRSPAAGAPSSALFDYVGFERRFRGDPALINAELARRYLARLTAHPPVLDIGCGNAGLVEMLAARGVPATGVDTDPSMVAEARGRDLDVRLVDGASFLRAQAPGSLGSIIATHVVEHLQLGELVELLELAATRLAPGGLFIAETPNPTSLIVLGNSYILDPTHVRPLHPALLTFLCEGAGFRDVRLEFHAPASGYHLPLVQDDEAPPWVKQVNDALAKLNHVLFGPQEYTIIATAAPPEDVPVEDVPAEDRPD
jgi:SAM-dependent methyltransferase